MQMRQDFNLSNVVELTCWCRSFCLKKPHSWWSLMHRGTSTGMSTGLRKYPTSSNSSSWAAPSLQPISNPWRSEMQFKKSKLLKSNFEPQVRNSNFSAFIDVFTANTYVMVILSDSQVTKDIFYQIMWLKLLFPRYLLRPSLSTSVMPGSILRSWKERASRTGQPLGGST